jgi:hypothetical protein
MHAARDIHYIICLDFKFHKFYLIWIDGEDAEDEVLVDDELKMKKSYYTIGKSI